MTEIQYFLRKEIGKRASEFRLKYKQRQVFSFPARKYLKSYKTHITFNVSELFNNKKFVINQNS